MLRLKQIEVLEDDFGPTVYRAAPTLLDWFYNDPHEHLPLFKKYRDISNLGWLHNALEAVNNHYKELDINPSDFADEFIEIGWQPIPLDRADEKLVTATRELDQAIRQIERDNGYAVSFPGERQYVLENLKLASKILKDEGQILVMQIRAYAIDPLGRVVKRFGKAAVGIAADAALAALKEWLKAKAAHLLAGLPWP